MKPLDLASVLQRSRARWPGITVPARFEERVRQCLPADQPPEPWLASAPLEDLYLACACEEGSAAALAVFEDEHISRFSQYIGHMRPSADLIDEVKQIVRERLFVGVGQRPPKIAEYAAKGPVGAWVRVMAVRIALDLRRGRVEVLEASPQTDMMGHFSADEEVAYVKRQYGNAMQNAVARAVEEISPDQRRILKLHFIEGMTFDQMAALFGVHKVTMWRQIAAARETIIDRARSILLSETSISQSEFDSILRAVHSQLHLSLSAR